MFVCIVYTLHSLDQITCDTQIHVVHCHHCQSDQRVHKYLFSVLYHGSYEHFSSLQIIIFLPHLYHLLYIIEVFSFFKG